MNRIGRLSLAAVACVALMAGPVLPATAQDPGATAETPSGTDDASSEGGTGIVLSLFLFAVFATCFAFLFKEGTWSNAIRLVSVILAALVATSFFQSAGNKLTEWGPSYARYWDFLALWGLFVMANAILRGVTDFFSKVKVRFRKVTEQVGSPLLAGGVGWVMVCFTAMTLHTAPLPEKIMDYTPSPDQDMLMGLAPDVKWLSFVHMVSKGSLSQAISPRDANVIPDWKAAGVQVFPSDTTFRVTYAINRVDNELLVKETGSTRIKEKKAPEPADDSS